MIGKLISLPFVLVARVGKFTIWIVKSIIGLIFGVFRFFSGRIIGTIFGALLGLLLGGKSIGIKMPWAKKKKKVEKK